MDEDPDDTGVDDQPDESTAVEPTRAADPPVPFDREKLPPAQLPAAAPSRAARGLAFGSIVIGGLCGGLIGYAFTDLQCDDGCTALAGLGALVGALAGAIGVAIVAVLVLRAMDEWETVKDEKGSAPGRDRPASSKSRAPGPDDDG